MKNNILAQFLQLPKAQQKELFLQLQSTLNPLPDPATMLPTNAMSKCVHCRGKKIVRFGAYKGKARFKCKECGRTFSEVSGTSLAYIKKRELWVKSFNYMMEGKTIRYTARELGVNNETVFNWRHKILVALQETFTKKYKGIVEMDDVFFKFSQKGRWKEGRISKNGAKSKKRQKGKIEYKSKPGGDVATLFMADRKGAMDLKVMKVGRISKKDLDKTVNKKRLKKRMVICSDSHPSIGVFVREAGYKHEKIMVQDGERVREGIYHVNKVNSLVAEFRRWMAANFKGVSTKYLQHYLNWFMMVKILGEGKNADKMMHYCLQDIYAQDRKNNIEKKYQQLVKAA